MKKIPWVKNQLINELARSVSSLGEWTIREIVAQVELLPQLEANSSPEVKD